MSAWDDLPVDTEFQSPRFTAFVTLEIPEDLAEAAPKSILRFRITFGSLIIAAGPFYGLRVAFEPGEMRSHDHKQLRVRATDARDLLPDDKWDQLVTANPKVMGGMPVFAYETAALFVSGAKKSTFRAPGNQE